MSDRDYYNPEITIEEEEQLKYNAKLIAKGCLPCKPEYYHEEAFCEEYRWCYDRLGSLKRNVKDDLRGIGCYNTPMVFRTYYRKFIFQETKNKFLLWISGDKISSDQVVKLFTEYIDKINSYLWEVDHGAGYKARYMKEYDTWCNRETLVYMYNLTGLIVGGKKRRDEIQEKILNNVVRFKKLGGFSQEVFNKKCLAYANAVKGIYIRNEWEMNYKNEDFLAKLFIVFGDCIYNPSCSIEYNVAPFIDEDVLDKAEFAKMWLPVKEIADEYAKKLFSKLKSI